MLGQTWEVDGQSPWSTTSRVCGTLSETILAATCDFQQCGILTSVDSDEPVQPSFKLKNSKWCLISILEY